MTRAFLSFALALLLGGSATWLVIRPSPSKLPGPAEAPLSPTPASLSSGEVSAAIAAWLALGEPAGVPAGFARRADTLRALLVRLPVADFSRLLTPLALRLGDDERRLLAAAFDVWVERDPAAATRWAATQKAAPGFDPLLLARQGAREWARLDALGAATWACALPDRELALGLARTLLPLLARHYPERALALAGQQEPAFADELIPDLLAPLAEADPAAVLATCGPRLWRRGAGLNNLRPALKAWSQRDPAAALAWVAAQPRATDKEVSGWLNELAGAYRPNPGSLATALAGTPLPGRQDALAWLLSRWCQYDPQALAAWLRTFSDSSLRATVLSRAACMSYPDQPEKNLPLALAMPEGADRTEQIAGLLSGWSQHDPAAALAWMREQADPAVSAAAGAAMAAALGAIAREEPATALAEWAALPEGATKQAALGPIATGWARTDPAAALRWITAPEQAAGNAPGTIHGDLLQAWAEKEPLAALRWAEAVPEPELRNRYLYSLSFAGFGQTPRTAAADLYAQIQDPALRTGIVTGFLRYWLTRDPAAARGWLDSHEVLSPAQAAALLDAATPALKN